LSPGRQQQMLVISRKLEAEIVDRACVMPTSIQVEGDAACDIVIAVQRGHQRQA
jgi:hypothetical protein